VWKKGTEVEFAFVDDWLIFAFDSKGDLFFVSCELWHEWLDLPKEDQWATDAIVKYMLPIALNKWKTLTFEPALLTDDSLDNIKNYPKIVGLILQYGG
jgi:hypothetical protein